MIELSARQVLPMVMYDNKKVYIGSLNGIRVHEVPYNTDDIEDPEEKTIVEGLLDYPIEGIRGGVEVVDGSQVPVVYLFI